LRRQSRHHDIGRKVAISGRSVGWPMLTNISKRCTLNPGAKPFQLVQRANRFRWLLALNHRV
jgi:hypothetical protein